MFTLAAKTEGMENAAGDPAWTVLAPHSSRTSCVIADGYQDSCGGRADLKSPGARQCA